ncbi:MAG: hypothetical protein Kow00109_12060 [Acidobacteriota bacterium]
MEHTFQLGASLLALLFIAGGSGEPAGAGVVLDRILAWVDDRPITFSDLYWQIQWRGYPVPEDPEAQRRFYEQVVEQLIDQELILREVGRTPFIQVSEEDVDGFLDQFRRRFPGEEAYRTFLERSGMREEDLRRILRRQLVVNRFIRVRFEPFVVVLPEDVEAYYQEHFVKEAGSTGAEVPRLELVRDSIYQILTVERSRDQLEAWLERMRARVKIRRLLGSPGEGVGN